MTWRELRERIERMPDDQKDCKAIAWGECTPIREVTLEECFENMYYNKEWEYSVDESDLSLDELENPDTKLIVKEGTYYLFF